MQVSEDVTEPSGAANIAGEKDRLAGSFARRTPWLLMMVAVGLSLGGLLIGYRPVGGDPDTMYRPMKVELAAALRIGQLPFWSDQFGMGVPLVAESHVAAFYPPNWVAYRMLEVRDAYALMMWLNCMAIAASTYAYARVLGIDRPGAALSGLVFTLCGFIALHMVHEPFLNALPYLPLCLLLMENYINGGGVGWLAGLALAWGAQLSVGHFQIPFWTGFLVAVIGGWRLWAGKRPALRIFGLGCGLVWGLAIGFVQLALTEELTRVSGFNRPKESLLLMSMPPAQWVQGVVPALFFEMKQEMAAPFWAEQTTIGGEAIFYVGTLPLILSILGWIGGANRDSIRPWKAIVLGAMVLASLPSLWPEAYLWVLQIPGFGWFRAPARYTLLTSLGLALLAGSGLDHAISESRFRVGMGIAMMIALLGLLGAVWISRWPSYRASVEESTIWIRVASAVATWIVSLGVLWHWRKRKAGWGVPLAWVAFELVLLFYHAPVHWGWDRTDADASPVLEWIKSEPDVGLVGGALKDVPAGAGLATAYPYFGITPPPPIYMLEGCERLQSDPKPDMLRMLRWYGVTHLVWTPGTGRPESDVAFSGKDAVLDRMLRPEVRGGEWRVSRVVHALPAAWATRSARVTARSNEFGWADLYRWLLREEPTTDVALYQLGQEPVRSPRPWATRANVVSWDGRFAVVDHDNTCDLIIRRTWYPGWMARIDGGDWQEVHRVNGGLQAVRLVGSKTMRSRVEFRYVPTSLTSGRVISLFALVMAGLAIGWSLLRPSRLWRRRGTTDAAASMPRASARVWGG